MPFKILSDATGEELYALQQAGLLWWVSKEDGGSNAYIRTDVLCPGDLSPIILCDAQTRHSLFGLLIED